MAGARTTTRATHRDVHRRVKSLYLMKEVVGLNSCFYTVPSATAAMEALSNVLRHCSTLGAMCS
eukprot:SAG11_NODE_1627_length_4552_cov_4.548619_4_plen_64_part_00